MKRILCLIFFLILGISILPTSTYAFSNEDYQSNSYTDFFKGFSLSSALSFLKIDNLESNQYYYSSNDYYPYENSDNSWDNFWKWWGGNGGEHRGDDESCYYSKSNWWDKDDCLESMKIWEKWYCR